MNIEDVYWIVILRDQKGNPLPMSDEPGRFCLFEAKTDAFKAGRENPLGAVFGFKVYRWGFFE